MTEPKIISPWDAPRLLTATEAERIISETKSYCGSDGTLGISIVSWWAGSQRWARNRASMTSDQRDIKIVIFRKIGDAGGHCEATTNQIDSASLRGVAKYVELYARRSAKPNGIDMALQRPHWNSAGAPVWSDATFNRSIEENGSLVHTLTRRAEDAGFLSAGYIESYGSNYIGWNRDGWGRVSRIGGEVTQAQCSITVRHPKGTGSGWAGNSSFDFAQVDPAKIAELAFEKCFTSIDPVRIEPGRYQTILEPQAAATFFQGLIGALSRIYPERGYPGPFLLGMDQAVSRFRSKLGLKIVDERITIQHDPTDPIVGTLARPGVEKVKWVDNGTLVTMTNTPGHAFNELVSQTPIWPRDSFKVSGGNTAVDDMIKSTKRGLLMSRVSTPRLVDSVSLLYTGVTRDGLWLIENGRITKAVRNFRWTESPLFILNNIEEIGVSVPVFSPVGRGVNASSLQNSLVNVVVPALKVNDFSFTSTVDAI